MKRILLFFLLFCSFIVSKSQNLSFTCPRDTILGCNTACFNLLAQIPDIRDIGNDYTLQNISAQSSCRPYVTPGTPGTSTNLSEDDTYSAVIPITFNFPFYGVNKTSLVVSTNGEISFDLSNADRTFIDYGILRSGGTLVSSGGTPENLPSNLYEKSIIMGPYHDIEPGTATTVNSPNQSIRYYVVGTAPNRKWVLSFYKIPLFDCNSLINNTHQIVLDESTGIIEVLIIDKEICTSWNEGRAMIGIQDDTRTKSLMAPGRRASDAPWGTVGMNEVWRFIPGGGLPLYRGVQLLDASGAIVATGDTTRVNANTLQTSFTNVCPPAGASFYVVKTTYQKLNDPSGSIYSLDTINVIRTASLPISIVSSTASTCGSSTGSITVSAAGTPNYQYSIDAGLLQASGTFSGLAGGSHTIHGVDATGCNNDIVVNIDVISSLPSNVSTSNTSCSGVNDGNITVVPTAGAGPYNYSIDGGVTTQSSGSFSNLSPGVYTITFTDANLCTGTTAAITITAGAALDATKSHTNTTCNGATDGTLTVTPTVAGSYTFTLNPGAVVNTTGIYTGLAPDNYTVVFTNTATGCSGTVSINVQVGGSITATWVHTNETCPGANDGIITITPSVPGSYTFTISPAPGVGPATNTTGIFAGISPGIFYNVSFVNATGCTGSMTTLFVLPAVAVTATQVHTNATCPGVNDGTITVTPSPVASYTYTLNPGAIVNTTGIFGSLAPNTYSVSVTNAGGCGTTINNIAIITGSGATATAVKTNTTCPGVNDGTITITPPATGAPFVYTLNPGSIVQNNNPVFTGLAPGTYTITFTTAAGCSGTVPANPVVGTGSAPTATAVATAATCPGVNNGTITITPPATGAPFIYTLNPGNIVQNNNPVFTGLATGTYTITFTTATGCNGTVPTNPVVNSGAAPTATASTVRTTCPGVNDGTITITPPGTGGPFVYTLNPGNIVQNNNPVFTGLATGTYTVTFTTATGCVGNVSTNPVVNPGPAPTATSVRTNTTCPGVNDGTITITPPATGGPFVYTLNPGNIVQNNNPVFTGLSPNTYTISFTNAIGCNGVVAPNPTVQAGPALTSTVTPGNPPCANINDGTITILPSLAGVYTYILNPGLPTEVIQANDPTFTSLAPGSYSYSFTNSSGCIGTGSVSLTTHAPLAASVIKTIPLCFGDANGTIKLTASGGLAPYKYATTPFATFQPAGSFNGLTAGTYSFQVKDNAGCTKDTMITLGQPTLLTASATSLPGTCNGNDGQITVTGNGGTAGYLYSIDGTTFQPTQNFTVSGGPAPGAGYSNIVVKDINGCLATAAQTYVTLIDNMQLTPANDTTICAEQSITFNPQVSNEASIFNWRTIPDLYANTINNTNIKNPTVNPLDTVTYILNAKWGVCFREDTITVNVLHKPVPYAGKDTAVCFDKTIATLHGSATNLSGTVNYEWTDPLNLQTPHNDITIATPPVTETFILTVTDNYGCNFSVSDDVTVTVQPPVPAFAGNDTIGVIGQPHQLVGSGGVAYSWVPSYPLNNPNIQNPLAILQHDQQFTVTVTDIAGCIGFDTVFVQVYPGPAYHVPNAFSPNGDGLNDIFRVIPAGISYTEWFRVFNRYGEMVFETNQWLKGWDGTYRGKEQPIGNYVWTLKGLDKNGKVVQMKGTVLLVR